MKDLLYSDKKIADLYDLLNPWAKDTDFYLSLASEKTSNILDIGCGTGILSRAFAEKNNATVVACDPSPAMLSIAKQNDHDKKVEWILATAQEYRSPILFDLIVMSGHTFQVFLTDEDILSVFTAIKTLLKPNGIFAFETRNPHKDWVSIWADNSKTISLTSGEKVAIATDSFTQRGELLSFTHRYTFPNEIISSTSTLRFASFETIEKLLAQAGLYITHCYGDWNGSERQATSKEMIFVGGVK